MAGTKNTDNNFTPLRLLLALLVVLGHFKAFVGIWSPTWPFNYAATAVDCFFVVSGYLVANSFDRDPNLFRFYTRRFFQNLPVVFRGHRRGGAGVGCNRARRVGGQRPVDRLVSVLQRHLRQFRAAPAFGLGVLKGLVDPSLNASLWTLRVCLYLIVPFLWRWQARAGSWPLIAIFALSAIYYQALLAAGHYDIAKQLPGQMQYFVLGIAAYRYRDRIPAFGPVTGLALTGVLATLVTLLQVPHVPVLFPLVRVAAFVIVATFRAPRLRMESDISYGVYLLHAPVIQLMLLFGLYRPDWLGLAAILAIVLPLAISAEHLIEPGIAFGRRVARGPASPGQVPPCRRPNLPA